MSTWIDGLVAVLGATDPGPSPPKVLGWVSFDSTWALAEQVAARRDEQKRDYASSRYWNPQSHFVGLLGEFVYGEISGQPVDLSLRIEGDGGVDFDGGVDVKATPYHAEPYLKHPSGSTRWPNYFALVAINLGERRGRYCGFMAAADLRACSTRDFGHGPQHVATEDRLTRTLVAV